MFTHPPRHLWRYSPSARNEAIQEWIRYGALALASIVGGGSTPIPAALGTLVNEVTFAPTELFRTAGNPATGAGSTIDAAGEYEALVFHAPKTGSLRAFKILISAVSGVPSADFSFETVGADGFPTGTLFGTNTNKAGVTVTVGWMPSGDFDFTADASVTVGTSLVAAVIRFNTGTSFTPRICSNNQNYAGRSYRVFNTGTPTLSTRASCIAVKYSDGTYAFIPGTFPSSSNTVLTAFGSGTNPNHRGAAYTIPTPKRCVGGWAITDNAGNYDFIIATDAWDGTADNDGTSNLTIAIDKDQVGGTVPAFILSDKSLTFAAGSKYRALYKPGATTITVYHLAVNEAAILGQTELGAAFVETTANDPTGSGSWTDATTRQSFVGFYFDQSDNGAGAGGGLMTHPGMSGGMRA